jgi:hypothetical protein
MVLVRTSEVLRRSSEVLHSSEKVLAKGSEQAWSCSEHLQRGF